MDRGKPQYYYKRNENKNSGKVWFSKSTVHRNMQRMKFSYITPRPVHNGQDKSKQEEFKKKILMKLLSCILKKSCFSSMNRGLAHIQRLDTGGLKKALVHRLR